MNRITLGLIVSALIHAAVIPYSGSDIEEKPEFNVATGRSSVDMVFSSAAEAAGRPEETEKQKEKAENEEKPDDNDESPDEDAPEKQTENVSENQDTKATKKDQADSSAEPSQERDESPPEQEREAPEDDSKKAAPQAAQHAGVKWVKDVDYRKNPPPRYPTRARVRHQEGIVRLLVRIGPKGRPDDISLEKSSGYALLDGAARDAVRRWRFEPAKKNGEPVESMTIVPVRFSLDR